MSRQRIEKQVLADRAVDFVMIVAVSVFIIFALLGCGA